QQAIEQARPYFEEAMKFAAPLGLMRLSPEQMAAVAAPRRHPDVALPTLEAAVASKTWLCGPPEQISSTTYGVSKSSTLASSASTWGPSWACRGTCLRTS